MLLITTSEIFEHSGEKSEVSGEKSEVSQLLQYRPDGSLALANVT